MQIRLPHPTWTDVVGARTQTLRLCGTLIILLSLASCRQAESTPTPQLAPVEPQPAAAQTPASASTTGVRPSADQRPLVVWLPSSVMPPPQSESGALLAQALTQFSAAQSGQQVEVLRKADEGQAGMVSYLRNAQQVAPAILPDLILIDTQHLWQVAELGLIRPLTQTQMVHREGFYNFAQDAIMLNERRYAVPYFANVIHLAYDTRAVDTPPSTWEGLLQSGYRFTFTAGGRGGQADEWLLLHFLQSGGQWVRGDGEQLQTTLAMFASIERARAEGVFPGDLMGFTTPGAVWSALLSGATEMASVPARLYLTQRGSALTMRPAPLPGVGEQPQTLATVYAFAILATDQERQEWSLALIDRLLAPEVHGRWAFAESWLPTREEAFQQWPVNDEYVELLQDLLATAAAPPSERSFMELSKQLQQGLSGVISGELTPEAAAQEFAP